MNRLILVASFQICASIRQDDGALYRYREDFFKRDKDDGHKSKWDLLHVQDNNPYDDRRGWVTLDAVPWSASKVSKWRSKHQPATVFNDGYGQDWDYKRPDYYERPDPRPGYRDAQRRKHHRDDCDDDDIITDGLPANFPSQEKFTRRRDPDESNSGEDGEWVLLSTTKGYKYPKHKQRSLQIADSVSTHRSVHLTVLPPAKDSKVNMTTSHGGLLEVESTFETVDEAQKTFARRRRMRQKPTRSSKIKATQNRNVISATTKKNKLDTSAVLAAVGAGMIPATMAMLVPMAMGGRRKRFVDRDDIEITLPRSI